MGSHIGWLERRDGCRRTAARGPNKRPSLSASRSRLSRRRAGGGRPVSSPSSRTPSSTPVDIRRRKQSGSQRPCCRTSCTTSSARARILPEEWPRAHRRRRRLLLLNPHEREADGRWSRAPQRSARGVPLRGPAAYRRSGSARARRSRREPRRGRLIVVLVSLGGRLSVQRASTDRIDESGSSIGGLRCHERVSVAASW